MNNSIVFARPAYKWLFWLTWLLLPALPTIAQNNNGVVTGTVISEQGEMLSGVSVTATNVDKKTEVHSTATDEKGVFTFNRLTVGATYSFEASYIGFETNYIQKFSVKEGNNSVLIKLTQSKKSLDEVVVIGYGSQKRETVTGSVATVRSEDFNKGVISDPVTLITGKVAGLAVSRPNGSDPNATAEISLRGAVSIEGTSGPLIVIDGVIGGDLRTIAPADIASMDILRDGSAAAIYGSRATGGVIIVTTKKGSPGPTRVTYNGYMSTETIANRYQMLNGDQYRKFAQDNNITIVDEGEDTDWFRELTRTPFNNGHNLSFSGGANKTTYNASVNYQRFQGIDLKTDRKFVNATLKLNTKALNDKLDFTVMLANSFDNKYFADYYAFGQALNMNPTFPVYDQDGNFYENTNAGSGTQWNPVANTMYTTNNNKEKRLLGNAKLSYQVFSDLKAAVSYSIMRNDFLTGQYVDNRLLWMQTSGLNGTAQRNQSHNYNDILETTLEYSKEVNDHSFNAVAGYSYQKDFNEGLGAANYDFISNAYLYHSLAAGRALRSSGFINRDYVWLSSFADERVLLAYFGRLIYSYQDRYLFNVSLRREGASVLGAANKWANFPGISAGWIISKEDFMSNVSFVKNLKLRGGYGETGNQYGLRPYQSLSSIGPRIEQWGQDMPMTYMNGEWIRTYGPSINPNPNLRWENKKETNIGLDFTLFRNGWLSGSLDLYSRKIDGLIGNYYAQVPAAIYPLTFANAGTLRNKGMELSLNASLYNTKQFTWSMNFVSAYNDNKIESFSSDLFQGTASPVTQINGWGTEVQRMEPGHPVGAFYGKRFAGFADDGQWLFYDKEGKPVTSGEVGDNDYAFLGNGIPRYNLGLTNNFIIGNFDATIMIRSALKFDVLNAKRIFHENLNGFGTTNMFTSALDNAVKGEPTFSSYYLEKGDYLKVDNLTIGYSVPINNETVKRIRLSVTATNLLLITGFSGIDPELGVSGPFSSPGVEMNDFYYPRTRSFTFGVQVDF